MRTIKICPHKAVYDEKTLDIMSMKENGSALTITLNGKATVAKGDKLQFRRMVRAYGTSQSSFSKEVAVKDVITSGETYVVTTEIPSRGRYSVISGITEKGFVKTEFEGGINIFAQDLYSAMAMGNPIKVTLKNGYYSGETTGIAICIDAEADDTRKENQTVEEYLIENSRYERYNECDGYESGYTLSPEENYVSNRRFNDSLFLETMEEFTEDKFEGATAVFSQNEYYFKDKKGYCTLWDDLNDEVLKAFFVEKGLEYDDTPNNSVAVNKNMAYWSVPIGAITEMDDVHLDQERVLTEILAEDVKSQIPTDVIDMEKVKYSPVIKVSNGEFRKAESITFNFHFREREGDEWSYVENGYWNNINGLNKITEENVGKSDLLSDLDFVDNDLWYNKMKVQRSFIRLSFYNSDNPLDQSMLYYSTVFLDGGALYGKFVKKRVALLNDGEEWDTTVSSSYVIENSDDDSNLRLDSKIVIKNEYNTDKSSEGFNLYLFLSDAPTADNSAKTIYMKVEFNHAGFGRTLPMVWLPSGDDSAAGPLTMANYRDALYIPVKIVYVENEYKYYIEGRDNAYGLCYDEDAVNGTITLNLFEPRLKTKSDE